MKTFVSLFLLLVLPALVISQTRTQSVDNLVRQIDPNLEKAKAAADKECTAEATKNDPVSWYLKAYVYKEMMKSVVHKKKFPNVGIESLNACKKVKELDVRKDLWPKVINVLFDISPLFYNDGIAQYNNATKTKSKDDFKAALTNFEYFKEVISTLEDDKEISLQLLKFHKINVYSIDYFAAYCAQQTGDNEKAKKYYKNSIIFDGDADNARLHGSVLAYYYYAAIMIDEKNYTDAARILIRGLELYPDNKELPTLAIELTKKSDSAEEMVLILEKITQIQPNNLNVYTNLATNYAKICDKMTDKGYASSASEYRDKAAETYKKLTTMTTDKKFLFTYSYNAAILYYKPASKLYKENQALNEVQYTEIFNKSLPFFEAAYKYDTNNKGVVEILVSIYQILKDTDNGVRMENILKNMK